MLLYCSRLIFQSSSLQILVKNQQYQQFCTKVASALRNTKGKSKQTFSQYFVDSRRIRALGGSGGDGCISFLSVYKKEFAGTDGGDGGNGGHVVLKVTKAVRDLNHIPQLLQAPKGDDGRSKDRHGKNAKHLYVNVPVGTIIRNEIGEIVGDLGEEGMMFVAARGGAGGRGNKFFTTATEQAPKICEYGAQGEDVTYLIELKTMAHIGLIGFPNAGKSTLLNAITRAKPKVAPYPFTTLKPHVGMVEYDDYEQIAVADLPGLIPDSHKNKGLGIQFLKHVERCSVLLFLIDASIDDPWNYYETLIYELKQFSPELLERPRLIVANKMDLQEAKDNLDKLKRRVDAPVVPISAKMGMNVALLLQEMRRMYDTQLAMTAAMTTS